MNLLVTVLLILAAITFLLAAFNGKVGNLNLTPLGLLFWVLSVLLPRLVPVLLVFVLVGCGDAYDECLKREEARDAELVSRGEQFPEHYTTPQGRCQSG